ncbi:valine--tRNA ligase, partial [Buchnera aphidicola (Hormaphis cornu)]
FVTDILLKSGRNYLTVATTRPETIFADVAIAVNPNDVRYRHIIGQKVLIPIINRIISIIGDDYVDMRKGTGCLKVSPAHDFNDYEIGCRHKLPMINIFTKSGQLCKKPQIYLTRISVKKIKNLIIPRSLQNIDRFIAREQIVILLQDLKLIEDVKKHSVSLPYGDRSNVIIEPRLTSQWFLKMSRLSSIAIQAVKEKKIEIIPNQYENMYFSWMKDIKDWCISRQLWWGHRIPVWTDSNNNIYVGKNENDIRKRNLIPTDTILYQEKDVLDTWFSSALWIIASLGWPQNTTFLKNFYPTDVLVSGFDIIFFWIARMIMLSMYFIKDNKGIPKIPFKTVYITGLVRDEIGQKMSKSKGNVIDPIDVIDGISLEDLLKKRTSNLMQKKLKEKIVRKTLKQFPNGIESSGTDALRMTLASLAAPNRNINWDINRLRGYKNFCNKLWNICRFILINIKDNNLLILQNNDINKTFFPDKWILIIYNTTIKDYRSALDHYRFDLATAIIFNFIKHIFCDWYLELVKLLFKKKSELELYGTKVTLINVLESLLRLSHPIIPFITEAIWNKIKHFKHIQSESLMIQDFPEYITNLNSQDKQILDDMSYLKDIVIGLRNLRNKLKILPNQRIPIYIINSTEKIHIFINKYKMYLKGLARLKYIKLFTTKEKIPKLEVSVINDIEVIIPVQNHYVNQSKSYSFSKDIKNLRILITELKEKLNNKNFLNKAPCSVVELTKHRLMKYSNKLKKLLVN